MVNHHETTIWGIFEFFLSLLPQNWPVPGTKPQSHMACWPLSIGKEFVQPASAAYHASMRLERKSWPGLNDDRGMMGTMKGEEAGS